MSRFSSVITAIVGCATMLFFYYSTNRVDFLYIFDILSVLTVSYIIYCFKGILCKERVVKTGKLICNRCKGYYFGLAVSIAFSLILTYYRSIPCYPFLDSIILLLVSILLGMLTMFQGYIRRTKGAKRGGFATTFFGFLVGIASVLSFIAIYSLFGCAGAVG
jgi:hypothetical protein